MKCAKGYGCKTVCEHLELEGWHITKQLLCVVEKKRCLLLFFRIQHFNAADKR